MFFVQVRIKIDESVYKYRVIHSFIHSIIHWTLVSCLLFRHSSVCRWLRRGIAEHCIAKHVNRDLSQSGECVGLYTLFTFLLLHSFEATKWNIVYSHNMSIYMTAKANGASAVVSRKPHCGSTHQSGGRCFPKMETWSNNKKSSEGKAST